MSVSPIDGGGDRLEPQRAATMLLKHFRARWGEKGRHNQALVFLLQARVLDPHNREVVAALDEAHTFYAERARFFAEGERDCIAAHFAAQKAVEISPSDREMIEIIRSAERRFAHLKDIPKAEPAPVAPPIIAPPILPPAPPPREAETPSHFRARMRSLVAGAESAIEKGEPDLARRTLEAVLREDPGNAAANRRMRKHFPVKPAEPPGEVPAPPPQPAVKPARAVVERRKKAAVPPKLEQACSAVENLDLGALCSDYAGKIRAVLGPPRLIGRRGVFLEAEYAARRLERTSETIAYLRAHPHLTMNALRQQDMRIYDFIIKGSRRGRPSMFFKFSEGYVGAGMKENPQVFAELKSRVEKEAEILAPLIKAHEIEVRELSARTERDAQRSEWETRRQEAQVRKTALFAQAESTFRSKHYAAAADLFRQILQDIDPDDIQARCFYYLNLMHLQYDFLERSGADYTKIGRGNVLNKRHLILRGARRFWQRILAMRFLIRNQEKVPALTNVPAVRAIDPYMASLIGGGTDFRVFSGTGEARVAAGLEFNPELLENKIKLEIDREARRFLSAADVSNHKDNADQIPQLVTQGVGVD